MTIAMPANDEAVRQMSDALADLQATADEMCKTLDPDGEVRRKVNKVIAFSNDSACSYTSYLRKIHEEIRREFQEAFERAQQVCESMQAQIQCMTKPKMQRAQGRSNGAAKPAAKKNGNSSGGGGGDGGGDGDGPQRTRSTRKKSRSSKSVTTRPPRLPSSSSGKTAPTSPQVSSNHPQSNRGIAIVAIFFLFGIVFTDPSPFIIGLIVVCLLIITLVAMGYPDLAKHVWSSAPKLLKPLAADSDEESEDSNDES